MFGLAQRSKKTLSNELNIDCSTDNRRLNSDVVPAFSLSWTTPAQSTLPATINLGSATNNWSETYADNLHVYIPKMALATVGASVPSGAPLANNNNIYWHIQDDPSATNRVVHRWNGSAWENYNSQVKLGQAWFATGTSRRFFVVAALSPLTIHRNGGALASTFVVN